jgi:hypothetical protein
MANPAEMLPTSVAGLINNARADRTSKLITSLIFQFNVNIGSLDSAQSQHILTSALRQSRAWWTPFWF